RHFTGGSSVLMFGGGIKKGFLYGATAPERPCLAVENPVSVSDLHATIFTAMGISPKTMFEIENRPFFGGEKKCLSQCAHHRREAPSKPNCVSGEITVHPDCMAWVAIRRSHGSRCTSESLPAR
ncbi:MAG: DUF1501 domain-containing protein, partial [Proteobacteria bacterium]|nr:DUF1501 domain-containing protein [Pseudomonadota bacterium]